MKIYLASSWKNEHGVKAMAQLLRVNGHDVDAFCEEKAGRFMFHWSELGDASKIDAISMLESEQGKKAFAEDKKWLDWADCIILMLPSGRSAHLEAGYAVGQGKRLFIFGEFPKGEFDVMYGFADGLFDDPTKLVLELRKGE